MNVYTVSYRRWIQDLLSDTFSKTVMAYDSRKAADALRAVEWTVTVDVDGIV